MKTKTVRIRQNGAVLGTALTLAITTQVEARRFAYNYETTTISAGEVELESSLTWKTNTASDPDLERFDIRHELEYGVTDRLQLALYFADWRYEKSSTESGETTFRDVAVEGIYNMTNPNTSIVGSALYGEIKGWSDFIEVEGKLLLQRNWGSWVFLYNVGGEVAWENDSGSEQAELIQSAGAAYQINPSWSVGTEILHELAVPEIKHFGDNGVYLGPNASWRNDHFSMTVAGLWQLTGLAGESDFQLRAVFSVDF